MYNVQKNLTYFVVNRSSGRTTEMTRDELVVWVAHLLKNTRAGVDNPFRDIDFSGNDKVLVTKTIQTWRRRFRFVDGEVKSVECWGLDTVSSYESRSTIVLDSTGRIVDVRDFVDEAKKVNVFSCKKEKRRTFKAGTLLLIYHWLGSKKETFKFRQGAVPFVHKRGGNYTPKTHRLQNYKNAENLRPKNRVSMGDMCEFPYRPADRSWKSSCKKRHQWEKHLK